MKRLSLSLDQMQSHYSVVVVGSGYGGAIAASRLARAGQSVCLLERGREFLPGEYPDTEAEARRLFRSRELWRLKRDRGLYLPLPSVEEAEEYQYSDLELARVERMRDAAMIGTPEQVKARLEALSAAHGGVAEFAVITHCHDPVARRRSYTLLAEVFGVALVAAAACAAGRHGAAGRAVRDHPALRRPG